MAKFVLLVDRIINLYLYFVVIACFLSLVPNINPNYPLFHMIFKLAGFYVFPPIFGVSFSCMIIMMGCAMLSVGLKKLYIKKFLPKEPKVIVISKDEFEKQYVNVKEENQEEDSDANGNN